METENKEIIKKIVDELTSNGDYTCYHKKHILAVCYHIIANAPIVYKGRYNCYPVPHFDMEKGFGGIKINIDLIDWVNDTYFFEVREENISKAVNDAIRNAG